MIPPGSKISSSSSQIHTASQETEYKFFSTVDWTHITSLGYDPFHNQLSLPGADTQAQQQGCVSPPHTFHANVQRSSGGGHRCLPSQKKRQERKIIQLN